MKHFIATVCLGLSLGLASVTASAQSGITSNYYNANVLTTPPVVDAVSFFNAGEIDIETLNVDYYDLSLPFVTTDTLYFTNDNSGIMLATPGWLFEHVTSSTNQQIDSASFFNNAGTLEAVDNSAELWITEMVNGEIADGALAVNFANGSVKNAVTVAPALSQPVASQVVVLATNIVNTGAISVGDCGLLSLTGSNVSTAYGTLTAGAVSTVSSGDLVNIDSPSLTGQGNWGVANGSYYFLPSPGVFDVFWGVTNADTVALDTLSEELEFLAEGVADEVTPIGVTPRGEDVGPGEFPLNLDTAQWSVSAVFYIINTTNYYYNVILVNTNFSGANITATAGFSEEALYPQDSVTAKTDDANALENIVQFAEPVYDVITGQTVTNGVYLIDDGAILPSMVLATNASEAGSYSRPNTFEVTTATPYYDWAYVADTAALYGPVYNFLPAPFYTAGKFKNNKVPLEISEYGAQIGHNPADIAGSFSSLASPDSDGYVYLTDLAVILPDPTNDPGRIQISANNLDITQSRLRAEGMVVLNVSNLIGSASAAVDWGEADASIGVSSNSLNISHIFPTTFQRVRGDIYAWSATWQNTQTNTVAFGTNNTAVTNTWSYHVLIVDQNLFGSMPSTVRNLTLTGSNSIVVNDTLNVINQAVFNTTNLTLQSSNYFGQNAENFTSANTPYMKNLFVNTNGFLGAENLLNVGFNAVQGPSAPTGRTYIVNTITNFGQMSAIVPQFQSDIFENDGTITAGSVGSILIEANQLGLGLALTNNINYLEAGGDVELSAATIQASNSVITAGLSGMASLSLYATEQLTDFVPGTPTTNTNSMIINHWTTYGGGFTLPVKPASGDLFGTEIDAVITNFDQPEIVWAAEDRGPTAAGFVNNAVIGRLVLDRQSSNSLFRFITAGARNAMYVDYLDLTDYGQDNYRTTLDLAGNFAIYFADSNVDPQKLTNTVPGLVWVSSFTGPNSSQPFYYPGSPIVVYLNSGIAESHDISFWEGTPNYDLLNGLDGMEPYTNLLINPQNSLDYITPPGTYSFPNSGTPGTNARSFLLVTTNASASLVFDLLTIDYNGQGAITLTGKGSTTPITNANQLVVGNTYSLAANPAKGWLFENVTTAKSSGRTTNFSTNLTFAFVTNMEITVNFIPTPFPALQGVYNGLFFQTNAVDPASAGAVSLKLAKTGIFSGKLSLGPSNYTFSSQFDGTGAAQVLAKSGASTLTLNLQLDLTNQSGEITGIVTNSGAWEAALTADLAPTWTARNPSPFAGNYTMALPWITGTEATNEPGGDSYAVGTVSDLGVLRLAGALADGAPFSVSAPVSTNGDWPFYVYAESGQDTVVGWVTVSNGLSGSNISWSKKAGKGPLYVGGFSNILQLIGSPWHAPTAASPVLTNLFSPVLSLSGGDLPQALSIPVTNKNDLTYSATNASLTISAPSGKFSGWFDNPVSRKKTVFSGVVLTNEVSARGFFLGTNQSGAVLLQNQN